MDVLERLKRAGIVPVVVLDHEKDAVPCAKAILAGGLDVVEVTFRTAAAAASIRAMVEQCPDVLVGAGTIVTLEQCKEALACNAKFIVSPGYDEKVVAYCMERQVTVIPGCVTPTELMAAMSQGLRVVKYFPAQVYGGLDALKALAGPFPALKFIPTGGVNADNLAKFSAAPFVYAVGGSWMCSRTDISAGNFEKITALCRQAKALLPRPEAEERERP